MVEGFNTFNSFDETMHMGHEALVHELEMTHLLRENASKRESQAPLTKAVKRMRCRLTHSVHIRPGLNLR